MDVQNLDKFESVLKMVTGREMLSPPLPEKRFFFKVLSIKDITLSWAYISFLLIKVSPPSY